MFVVATRAARHFVDEDALRPLRTAAFSVHDLAALNKAAEDGTPLPPSPRFRLWTDEDEWSGWRTMGDPVLHIEVRLCTHQLRRWADLVLVAPLSANTLAKLVHGLCDNLATSFLRALAPATPTWLFPAMNTLMYLHPLTAKQLEAVQTELGYEVFGPVSKRLACGDLGRSTS